MQGSESASVVVKLLKVTANSKDRQSFLAHIHQAKRITRSSHPHLVKMMGCVTVHEPVCLIAENPSHGDFLTFLQKARKEVSGDSGATNCNLALSCSCMAYSCMHATQHPGLQCCELAVPANQVPRYVHISS